MATWINPEKSGSAWVYDDAGFEYDRVTDPITGQTIFYDGIGTVVTFTNQTKSV